jgi:hypothetical protein
VTERMFADPSILDSITSDPPAPRQDESTGCLVPSAAPEVVEGVLRESAAGTESAVIDPLPTSVGENTDAPLLQLQRQPRPRPLLRWSALSRESSEEWGHRCPSLLPPPQRRFPCRASPLFPLRNATPRGRDKGCLPPRARRP